jgi:hypothetical protein
MSTKEQIIAAALSLDEYERKQIALVLIGSTLTELSQQEAIELLGIIDQ